MEIGNLADLLKDGGPWGLISVLLTVIYAQYTRISDKDKEIAAIHEKRVGEVAALADKTAAGLEKSTSAQAAAGVEVASYNLKQQALTSAMGVLPGAIEAVARQVEANMSKIDRLSDWLREREAR